MDLSLLEPDKKAVKFEGTGEIWSGDINVYVYMAFSLLSVDQNFIGGGFNKSVLCKNLVLYDSD